MQTRLDTRAHALSMLVMHGNDWKLEEGEFHPSYGNGKKT